MLRNLYDCVEIPDRFKEYWKIVDQGTCSYANLMKHYPSSLDPTENKKMALIRVSMREELEF